MKILQALVVVFTILAFSEAVPSYLLALKRNPEAPIFLNNQIDPRFQIPSQAQEKIMHWIKTKNALPQAIRAMLGDLDLINNDTKEFFMRF